MRLSYFALLFSLLSLSSCDSLHNPLAESNVSGTIQMQALEGSGGQGRQLYLAFQDEGSYSCSNYSLDTDYEHEGKQLVFNFKGVSEPKTFCQTAIGPARYSVDISDLPVGTYALRFQSGPQSTKGELEIQDSYLRLSTNSSKVVRVRQSALRFMPRNVLWGYATTSLPASQASVEVLRDSLQRLGATPTTLPPGVYSQLNIAANGLPEPPQVSVGTRALVLLASYQGSPERIQAYVRRANAATPGLNLWLNTSGI
jgi:hypothetical protein